jgi:hypothetical protein
MGKNHSFWLHYPRVTLHAIAGRANAVFIEENHRRPVYEGFVKAMSRSALYKVCLR